MALSLGVNRGSKINVGNHRVEVLDILTPVLIEVAVDGGPGVLISDAARTEVLPKVFVSAGVGGRGVGNRLAFEAPRDIRIHRVEEEVAA